MKTSKTTHARRSSEDVLNSWIDELTIKQFNEELKGVFLMCTTSVKEANKTEELGPEDVVKEAHMDAHPADMEKHLPKIYKMRDDLVATGMDPRRSNG